LKRFVETTRWDDPWYRNLSPLAKNLWDWVTDKCSLIGIIDLDLKAASFHIGARITEKHLDEIKSRLKTVPPGKWLIKQFVRFQYGQLSEGCPAHKPVLKALKQCPLEVSEIAYPYPNATLAVGLPYPTGKGIGKGKEPEKETESDTDHYHKHTRIVLYYLNEKAARKFRETDQNLEFISARLREPDVTLEGVKVMIDRQCRRWLKTDKAEYLRPPTLFNATKFDGYYAAREQKIYENNGPVNQRLVGIATDGSDYGEAAKRKLERQMAEANNSTSPQVEGA